MNRGGLILLALLLGTLTPIPLAAAEPISVTTLNGLPITFLETDAYVRLGFTMFTVEFYKGAFGYNKIYDRYGAVLVYDDRTYMEYLSKKPDTWKQRGVPMSLSYVKYSEYYYEVTRHYGDFLGTSYDVVYTVRSDMAIKTTVKLTSGQADTYRVAWVLSGITKLNYVQRINQVVFGDDQVDYDWICFDWADVYQSFGGITQTSYEPVANGIKAKIYFNVGAVAAGAYIEIDPSTIGTSTNSAGVAYGFQRKGFYAAGLFWAFYSDGTNAGWEFSNDGTTWTGAFTSIGPCPYGYSFSVEFDGTYIHYVRNNNYDLFYRRGIPQADGTITWSQGEQTVYDGASGNNYQYPSIAVDTNGYAWIGVYNDQPDGDDFPVVLKNKNNDGTWTTDFTTELSAVDVTTWRVVPVPLTDGKVYVVYCQTSQAPLGQLYDAGWGAEETDLADYNIERGNFFSVVALGDNVHFVYNRDVTYQIRHNERVWGVGWNAADVLVQTAVQQLCGPALSVDLSTGDLYCFWTNITPDHVYYKKYSSDSWDANPTDWIDESTDDIEYDYLISSFYRDYGGYIGLLYVTRLANPYNVRFEFLTLIAAPINYPRSAAQGITIGGDADRAFIGIRGASQSITASVDADRLCAALRNALQALTLSSDAARAYTGARTASQDVDISPDGDRVYGSIRRGSQSIGVTSDGERIYGGVRSPTQSFTLSSSTSRILTMRRGASQTISTLFNATSVFTRALVAYVRGATLVIDFTATATTNFLDLLIYVVNTIGNALTGANVTVWKSSGPLISSGIVNATGYYDVGGVLPGNYTVLAEKTSYQTSLEAHSVTGATTITMTLQVLGRNISLLGLILGIFIFLTLMLYRRR